MPDLPGERRRLLQQQACFDSIAFLEEHFDEEAERPVHPFLVPHLLTECKTLLDQRVYFGWMALGGIVHICQFKERLGGALLVAHVSEEGEALLCAREGSAILPF